MKRHLFIGIYDYTVIMTYVGLIFALAGIFLASSKFITPSIFCLSCSAFCDMFDGKIARTKKERTEKEKLFGMQIDSLCDLVSFGILPCVMFANLGDTNIVFLSVLAYYVLCSLIRLAYFNTLEIKRIQTPGADFSVYHGLPVIAIAVLFPCVYILNILVTSVMLQWIYCGLYFVLGTLYIADFPLKKPGKGGLCLLSFIVLTALIVIAITSAWRN